MYIYHFLKQFFVNIIKEFLFQELNKNYKQNNSFIEK